MRFFVKAYTMHEREELVARAAIDAGQIQEAEITEAYVQGIADEGTIKQLAKDGLVMHAMSPAPSANEDQPAEDLSDEWDIGNVQLIDAVTADVSGAGGDAPRRRYMLVQLLGAVTDQRLARLQAAGCDITERDAFGWYVAKVAGEGGALRALPFVGDVRPYGVDETLSPTAGRADPESEAAAVSRSLSRTGGSRLRGVYEAVLHAREDAEPAAAAIEGLGAKVLSRSPRVVRFTLKDASLRQIAAIPAVASVEEVKAARPLDDVARQIIRATPQAGGASFPYDGNGQIVGVADTGLDDTHPDFQGRIVRLVARGRPGDTSDPDGHGTHVAGTVLGDGSASNGRLAGIAPRARLFFQSVMDANGRLGGLPTPLTALFQEAYDAGVRVHNNSWGAYLQSRYAGTSLEVDEFVNDNPEFLPIIAAGNEGSCRPGIQASQGFVDYPSLGAPATAKNALTVGASRSSRTTGGYATLTWGRAWSSEFTHPPIRDEQISGNPDGLAGFSSRGPCDDMRIKPDVVAPGTDIASAKSKDAPLRSFWGAYPNNPRYAFNGGTSMACPIVAGCAALVRQHYDQAQGYATPSAALVKATIINGTTAMTGADASAPPPGFPNYHQGFGRVNMEATLPHPVHPAFRLHFVDTLRAADAARRFQATGQRRRWRVQLAAAGELRICLAWTDWPGRSLQNGLFMILDDGGPSKWVSNDGITAPLRVSIDDPLEALDNEERVLTRDPHNNVHIIRQQLPAGEYTLAVFADNLLRAPQDYALVLTGPIAVFSPK